MGDYEDILSPIFDGISALFKFAIFAIIILIPLAIFGIWKLIELIF